MDNCQMLQLVSCEIQLKMLPSMHMFSSISSARMLVFNLQGYDFAFLSTTYRSCNPEMVRWAEQLIRSHVVSCQIVFSEAWWVGTKEENPEELRLEFPKELQNVCALCDYICIFSFMLSVCLSSCMLLRFQLIGRCGGRL